MRMLAKILDAALMKTRARTPDVMIGGHDNPYMLRWFVIPRNRWLNIYHHMVLRSDDDRALHDHPWWSISIVVNGGMFEHRTGKDRRFIPAGKIVLRTATSAHRLELEEGKYCRTLFITGPRIREWGFYCPKASPAGGWRHWKDFTSFEENGDSTTVGRGCGEME